MLVCNTCIEQEASRKSKPRYLGPMVVVRETAGGSFILSELDGAVSTMRFAAFRLVPYFPRSDLDIPVTDIVKTDGRMPVLGLRTTRAHVGASHTALTDVPEDNDADSDMSDDG